MHRSSKTFGLFFVSLAICLFGLSAQAEYGRSNATTTLAETSTYVFLSDQSTVVQTGGIAGVHEIYPIKGQFRLSVDFDAGTASFSQVDSNLISESSFLYTKNLGVLFNMTELVGTIAGDTTIDFAGRTANQTNTDILLTLTFTDDLVHLTGETIPPPNSADFFHYNLDAVARKKYGGGVGEPNEPYLIYTAEQMNALGAEPNDWDKHFRLMADIDLSGYTGTDFNTIGYLKAWDQREPFTGVFDGNGHTISNFAHVASGADRIGLFGYMHGKGAEIKNLGLIDPNVDAGTGNWVGSLVGFLGYGSVLSGCSIQSGTITGGEETGGLVGYNGGTITNCYAIGNVTGGGTLGGLAGSNEGTISNCYSTGSVSGDKAIGGLVGQNGGTYSGREGLVIPGGIDNCYSTGSVIGRTTVGGLVGYNDAGTITNCYSAGCVMGDTDVGGLVGDDNAQVISSFWNVETSGQSTSAGGAGLTTAEMKTANMFLEAGWDFVDETENGTEDIWWILEGQDYPRLTWELVEGNSTASVEIRPIKTSK